MCRVIFIVAVALVAFSSADIDEKCRRLYRPETMFCCEKPPPRPSDKMDYEECADLPMKPFSTCAKAACIAKKNGLLSEDGIVNKKGFTEMVDKNFANEPEIGNLIKEKCIDGDYTAYGPKDFCDLMKMKDCMHIQLITKCPKFRDDGMCSGTAKLVEECSSSFP